MLSWSSHHLNQCTRICVTRTGASPLVLPRSRTHAALPETSSGGDAVRPHPVTRNGNRRAYEPASLVPSGPAPQVRARSSSPEAERMRLREVVEGTAKLYGAKVKLV